MGGEVAGRAAIARAVRERAERGVDAVKVMASGEMNTRAPTVMSTQFTDAPKTSIHAAAPRVG
jgi:hypothetical protein